VLLKKRRRGNLAYICDIVIAVIVLVSAIVGRKRGFVKTAFGLLSFVCAIVLSYFFGSYAGDYIKTTSVYEDLSRKATLSISEYIDKTAEAELEKLQIRDEEMSESEIVKTLERLGLETDSFYDRYEDAIKEGTENAKEKFAQNAATKVMECLANALGVLVTFVLSLVALKILGFLVDRLFRLPVLNGINRLGGFIVGLVLGIFSVYILCMIVEILLPYIPQNPVIYAGMEKDTILYNFFVNLNPVIFVLFG
jgi:uncharacterized membrane protein required for colicin V production